MKTIITAGLVCAVVGVTAGWKVASNHYEPKARKERDAYYEAVDEITKLADHYKTISEEYYADYQDAINREPTVVTERVFVKGHCEADAAADSGGELGDGAAVERFELHKETVASATRVTDQAERDVLECRAALHSLQRKIKTHNELQR